MEQHRPRLNPAQNRYIQDLKSSNNILVIGDLHAPFIRKGYLEHCVRQRDRYSCDEIIFIGDIIDNHYTSFHETDPSGLGAADELDLAINMLKPWYKEFPTAKVTIGNHDRIVQRKATAGAIEKRWIKDYSEVLETPGWDFVDHYEKHNVLFVHGDGGASHAINRAKNDLQSVVQGHFHSRAYVDWSVGRQHRVFGMQVGCGVDFEAYAMAYGRNGKRPVISCAVVLDNGEEPLVLPMKL